MSCREICRIHADYLQNDLPAIKNIQFEEHIRVCPDCLFFSEIERKLFFEEKSNWLKKMI